jgi:plastocyanin
MPPRFIPFRRRSMVVVASIVCTTGLALIDTISPAGAAAAPGDRVSGQVAMQRVQETDTLRFEPGVARVKPGEVVEWENVGSIPHNVTFDQYPSITSGTMKGADRYEVRFTAPGTYSYHCTFHPGMNGSVTVG